MFLRSRERGGEVRPGKDGGENSMKSGKRSITHRIGVRTKGSKAWREGMNNYCFFYLDRAELPKKLQ